MSACPHGRPSPDECVACAEGNEQARTEILQVMTARLNGDSELAMAIVASTTHAPTLAWQAIGFVHALVECLALMNRMRPEAYWQQFAQQYMGTT